MPNDLGWTDDSPVFGGEPRHLLEGTIAKGQFILAPMQAATVSSVDIKTEIGAEFLQMFGTSHKVLPCLTGNRDNILHRQSITPDGFRFRYKTIDACKIAALASAEIA